jgi:hypothetical protein
MIKMRRNKDKSSCNSCVKNTYKNPELELFDIYVGAENSGIVITLCNFCMHELLTKLVKMGKHDEV